MDQQQRIHQQLQQRDMSTSGSEADAEAAEEEIGDAVFDRIESAGGRTLARAMRPLTGNAAGSAAYGQLLGSLNVCHSAS